MSGIAFPIEIKSLLEGKQIQNASSSLNRFVMKFADGSALLLEARGDAADPCVRATVVSAAELAEESEAVCRVDWGWICGSQIQSVDCRKELVAFQLQPAGPLRIAVNLWQGSPFLSFQPYRPAK